MSNEDSRKLLLNVILNLISIKPANQITIREIARAAGTNSAAISYHFGNKENLINEAMKVYWTKLNEIYNKILNEKQITAEKAQQFCKEIMQFYIKSTGITRTEQNSFLEHGINDDAKDRISLQFSALKHIIVSLNPKVTQELIEIKVIRFLSALSLPPLWVEAYEDIAPRNISLEVFLEYYIKDVINNL
jgi:AcrR family transcriptional regulator